VNDLDAASIAFFGSFARLTFEDNNNGLFQHASLDGIFDPDDQIAGSSRPVPPPAVWSGANDIGCIDHQHDSKRVGHICGS